MKYHQRMKVKNAGCYYHLFNRIAGFDENDYPFTTEDKEHGVNLIRNLCEYYLIEVISVAWMGNHFHLVVYAPGQDELPPAQEIAARHNNYYKTMKHLYTYTFLPNIDPRNTRQIEKISLNMIDISCFMKAVQQRFSRAYNKRHKRHGRLWQNTFRSVILQGISSLKACINYVELNPVRAGLTESPENYRHTTWGNYCLTGKHMFYENFVKHYRGSLYREDTSNWSDNDLLNYFRSDLKRIVAAETGAPDEEVINIIKSARPKPTMQLNFLQRTRHFTEGAILGSKEFILEIAGRFKDPEKVKKKHLSHGPDTSGEEIYCFRMLK